jgi:hypothetical protein
LPIRKFAYVLAASLIDQAHFRAELTPNLINASGNLAATVESQTSESGVLPEYN